MPRGGGGIEVLPTPLPSTPTPTPSTPLQPAHIGLVSANPFVTLSIGDTFSVSPTGCDEHALAGPNRTQSVHFTYLPASDIYQISLPNFETGKLVTVGLNGSEGQVATSSVRAMHANNTPKAISRTASPPRLAMSR